MGTLCCSSSLAQKRKEELKKELCGMVDARMTSDMPPSRRSVVGGAACQSRRRVRE